MGVNSITGSFWTMHVGGTWPVVSVLFGLVIALLLWTSWVNHANHKNPNHPHYHENEQGVLVKCYHACKQQNLFFSKMYWISLTLAFPLEHIVYHKLWPFYLLSNWLNVG